MGIKKSSRLTVVAMLLAAAALIAGCGKGSASSEHHKTMKWDKMPEMTINLDKSYTAAFTTSKGDFTVKLLAEESPVAVNNFVFLVREGFYDGLTFHRVIESYMIQGGDPQGNGTGSPGYKIPDELDPDLKYETGIVAMANAGQPNTGGSQFFIGTGKDVGNLNQNPVYTIFGKVQDGMDTVLAIAKTPVKNTTPIEPVIIEKIVIQEK
ncbi:peptidylprolyl isomerase [Paenibacillus sp. NPDC058071]|uniref:peptidylprolyl isomerase n=1 Tax=Paenibacillus sp. NPDC058071 TaxID=3346326 RepID=UPI0036DE6E8A